MRITLDKKFLIRATLSFFFFFMLESKTFATTEFKLLASDGAVGDNFGDSVSINGNVALIGANGDDDYGNESGSAYVFRWNGSSWVEEQKLLASDGAAGDRFGQGISISGDVALVAAPGSVGAYVFRWNGSNWVEEQKLLASDDGFGDSVSISGDVALLGASGENDKGYDSGAAFIFRWNGSNWVEEQKLLASDGAANDNFGDSVSISGDVALVGASEEEKGGFQLGKAYVFRWNGSNWVEEQILRASDGADRDHFGDQVSISGDVALVGAAEEEKPVPGPGKAYVFRWNGSSWVEEQKLLASDGGSGDAFGVGASVSGDVALVGVPGEDGEDKGSVYVFRWNGSTWVEEQMLRASDGEEGNRFGGDEAVSISGEVALVGADNDDEKGNGSGSAYVYAFTEPEVQFVVEFSANPTRGLGPLTVSFTDQSTGSITSWEWDFGDGSTSTIQNPTHTYTDSGTYTVSLTVTGPGGSDTNNKADYIKVRSPGKAAPWIPLLLTDD